MINLLKSSVRHDESSLRVRPEPLSPTVPRVSFALPRLSFPQGVPRQPARETPSCSLLPRPLPQACELPENIDPARRLVLTSKKRGRTPIERRSSSKTKRDGVRRHATDRNHKHVEDTKLRYPLRLSFIPEAENPGAHNPTPMHALIFAPGTGPPRTTSE